MKKPMPMPLAILITILFFGILFVGFVQGSKREKEVKNDTDISSFADCVAAGNPIMESYPEQCNTPDGKHFVNEEQTSIHENFPVGFLEGTVEIGPNCPVEIEGKPCVTPPEAYAAREVVVYSMDMQALQGRSKIAADGTYRVVLEPGQYMVNVQPGGIGPSEMLPVTIEEDKTTTHNIKVDTGIR
jgi:hypothetical protein